MEEEVGIKNEVFAAYDDLLNKLRNTKPAPTQEEEQVVEEKKQVVQAAVQEVKTDKPDRADRGDDVERHLTALREALNRSLDEIRIKLAAEHKKFATIQQAIEIQSRELDTRFGIIPEANTLEALVKAGRAKKETLEQEISHTRSQWHKEQETHENLRKETEAQLLKTRQREEENYLYNRDIFRRKETEEYEAKKRSLEQELQDKKSRMEESFREHEARLSLRETKLAAREQEFQQMQDEVAQFPTRLLTATQEAERALNDKLALKYEYEAKLLDKDFESERRALKATIEALQQKIEGLETLNYNFKPFAYTTETAPTTV
jgi:hypothetical protein